MALNNTYDARLLHQETAVGAGVQILLLVLVGMAVGMGPAGWLTGLAFAMATWAVLNRALRRSRPRTFGPANRVTLGRSILVGGVTALVADSFQSAPPVTLVVSLTAVALILDGVDGKVARKTGTSTALGARFDMEVDAFLILVLSVYVAMSMGPWVLLIGAMRYLFVAVARVQPWLNGELPHSMARKTVAAQQGVVLLVAGSGLLPYAVSYALVAWALAALAWSFGRDIRWLWRNNRNASVTRTAEESVAPKSAELSSPAAEFATCPVGQPVTSGREELAELTMTDGLTMADGLTMTDGLDVADGLDPMGAKDEFAVLREMDDLQASRPPVRVGV